MPSKVLFDAAAALRLVRPTSRRLVHGASHDKHAGWPRCFSGANCRLQHASSEKRLGDEVTRGWSSSRLLFLKWLFDQKRKAD